MTIPGHHILLSSEKTHEKYFYPVLVLGTVMFVLNNYFVQFFMNKFVIEHVSLFLFAPW